MALSIKNIFSSSKKNNPAPVPTKLDEFLATHKNAVHDKGLHITRKEIAEADGTADYAKLAKAFESGDLKAEKVDLCDLSCTDLEFVDVLRGISKSEEPATELHFSRLPNVERAGYLVGLYAFKGSDVKAVHLTDTGAFSGEGGVKSFFETVGQFPKLERLMLNDLGMFMGGLQMKEIAAALDKVPLRDFSVLGNSFSSEGYEAFADFAVKKQLKFIQVGADQESARTHLNVLNSPGSLNDGNVESIARIMEAGHLERLCVSWSGIGKKGAQRLLMALQHPDCAVTKFLFTPGGETAEERAEADKYHQLMKDFLAKRNEGETRRKASVKEILESPFSLADIRKDGKLFLLAEDGKFGKVFELQGEKPTAFDYLSKNAEGETLLSVLARQGELKKLFRPDRWNDVKEMKQLWDQMDPSFRKEAGGEQTFNTTKNALIQQMIVKTQQGKRTASGAR